MKTRLPVGACILFLVCLNAMGCFRSVDGSKVRCTSSDHCPSGFFCSGGKCVDHLADGGDNLDGNAIEGGTSLDTLDFADGGETLDGNSVDSGTPLDSPGPDAEADLGRAVDGAAVVDGNPLDLPLDVYSIDSNDIPASSSDGGV